MRLIDRIANAYNDRVRRKYTFQIENVMMKKVKNLIENSIPDSKKKIIGLTTKSWFRDGTVITHDRQVRGDLIRVTYHGQPIVEYVDQTHAYGFIGIHDVSFTPNSMLIEQAISKL